MQDLYEQEKKYYCLMCGKEIDLSLQTKEQKRFIRKRGYGYCSKACQYKHASMIMSRTNKKYASKRMKEHNPMQREDVKKKQSASLRAMGWKPPIHGGNGTGLTKPQERLTNVLKQKGIVCYTEYPYPTKCKRPSIYPTCYKADIAIIDNMIWIEIDGESHRSLRVQKADKKKSDFLIGRGWTVLRFKNQQVMGHLEDCVQMVLSTISKSKEIITTSPTAS